jgi:hypothetical protein
LISFVLGNIISELHAEDVAGSAPKGRNMTAQGIALGNEWLFVYLALKGRKNTMTRRLFRPFRA